MSDQTETTVGGEGKERSGWRRQRALDGEPGETWNYWHIAENLSFVAPTTAAIKFVPTTKLPLTL